MPLSVYLSRKKRLKWKRQQSKSRERELVYQEKISQLEHHTTGIVYDRK